MNSDRDPPTRLEESSEFASIRRAIRAARADVPETERMGALETGLAAKLAAIGGGLAGGGHDAGGGSGSGHGAGGGSAPGGGHAGGALGGGAAGASATGATGATGAALGGGAAAAPFVMKAIGTVVLASSVATGAWYTTHRNATETPTSPVIVVATEVPAPPSAPLPASPLPAPEDVPAAPKPADKGAPPKVAARAAEIPGESEMDLLRRAQDALSSDPKRALALCEVHKDHFANGTFTQEREVIAIDALLRLGRRKEAETRAERFDKAYPTSAHRRRIDSLLAP